MKRNRLVFFALVLILAGCDIFQTRTPQAPQQGQSGFLPPTLYNIVIENLQNAIASRDVNNYIACFSDQSTGGRVFIFQPSPKAGRQYQAIFQDWNISSERGYFNNLISQSSTSSSPYLNLSPVQELPGSDSAYYSADYTLIWPNKLSGGLQQVQGNIQLYLGVNSSGSWSIYRWVDSGTGDSTWSDMKAQFSIPQ